MNNNLIKYWPYDELRLTQGQNPHQFLITCPWISTTIEIESEQIPRVSALAEKINQQTLTPADLEDVSWFFSALSGYPMSYILPTSLTENNSDLHEKISDLELHKKPRELFLQIGQILDQQSSFEKVSDFISKEWKWDLDSALQMSQQGHGFNPKTLFSIVRRFHLLDSLESNKTQEMSEYVQSMNQSPMQFKYATALIVRQNHYVTEKCDSALRPALKIAQKADGEVLEFIQAESGHDVILGKALKSMGLDPQEVPVIEPIAVLMSLFQFIAGQNFLAFSMVVDMFERSSYQEHDPLANLLSSGGQTEAAKQIDIHKDINDSGEHENVALGFLNDMACVDSVYAQEAFQLAELATDTIHSVSKELFKRIKKN